MSPDYKLQRISDAAKRNLVPVSDLALFMSFVESTHEGAITQTDDRISFLTGKMPFRFSNSETAFEIADLIDAYFEGKFPRPLVKQN